MARTSEDYVREFHRALDVPVADSPQRLSEERLRLRLRLIAEEVAELVCALVGMEWNAERLADHLTIEFQGIANHGIPAQADYAKVLHEACDVHVVVSGTMAEMGLPEDAAYAEVHAANMRKAGGPTRADGKKLKPEGWTPADVAAILNEMTRG